MNTTCFKQLFFLFLFLNDWHAKSYDESHYEIRVESSIGLMIYEAFTNGRYRLKNEESLKFYLEVETKLGKTGSNKNVYKINLLQIEN